MEETNEETLKELTIKDNFMFGAVMTMPENCKDFLEMVLQRNSQRWLSVRKRV